MQHPHDRLEQKWSDEMTSQQTAELDGTGLLVVTVDIDPDHEKEVNDWYWNEHFPERLKCEGFQWGGRFRAIEGEPKYIAVYVLDSPEVLQSDAYAEIAGPSEWTKRILPYLSNVSRSVYERIEPDAPSGLD
jgi:hypothetical protein